MAGLMTPQSVVHDSARETAAARRMIANKLNQHLWAASAATHIGKLRKLNEDAFCLLSQQNFWLVADGMGGHAAGALSSQTIVDQFQNYVATRFIGQNATNILARLSKTNIDLTEYAHDNNLGIIGSTVAALSIHNCYGLAVWAGDSRIYRIRDQHMHQITVDHDQITEFMNIGLTEEQALAMPGSEAITRAIGSDEKRRPQVSIFEVQENDRYLLCTDGLTKELDDKDIASVVCKNNAEDSISILFRLCLASRARDNISVVVVE